MTEHLHLRIMSDEEYTSYYDLATRVLAEEESRAYRFSYDDAYQRAVEAFDRLVPDKKLSATKQKILVIEHGPISVGFLWYDLRGSENDVYILDVFILPAYRGQGFAKQALLKLEEAVSQIGSKRIFLNVFCHNKIAISLYESLNYSSCSKRMMKVLR